jgi:uncharacterized protein (TIGR02391 family)
MNLETEVNPELWHAVRRSYENGAYSNATLDSIHFLSEAIRLKTGLQSDGTALAGQALGGKNPKLRLNRLETESEQNIQHGVEQLLRGIYQAVRNPRSHGRVDDFQADANAIVLIVDYLLRIIGHARTEFSLDTAADQILESSFVPDERYASLLVAEIPPRQRLQVAQTAYQRKTSGDGEKLKYFFDAIISELAETDQNDFFSAVSRELREVNDDTAIKVVFQCLNPVYWPKLNELARLRIENHVVESLRDGKFDTKKGQCSAGWLATWATSFLQQFTMKPEVFTAIYTKMRSINREEQDYVLQFFFRHLADVAAKPGASLQNFVVARLKAGDQRYYNSVNAAFMWLDDEWGEKVKDALENFQPSQPVPEDDDDVPF